jgi:hypothetical protein
VINFGFGYSSEKIANQPRREAASRHRPLERLHQSADLRNRLDLIDRQRVDLLWQITNRRLVSMNRSHHREMQRNSKKYGFVVDVLRLLS